MGGWGHRKIIPGIAAEIYSQGTRHLVNGYHEVEAHPHIYAIGDISSHTNDVDFSAGRPQVAQVAIQQDKNLAINFIEVQYG